MRSMTGCGRGQAECRGWQVTAELRTVNHRFLDLALRLPRNLGFLEGLIRGAVAAGVRRGHVEVSLNVVNTALGERQVICDLALAKAYADAARQLSEATGIAADLPMAQLMQLEGVTQVTEAALDEEAVAEACAAALAGALERLNEMRGSEGQRMREDLRIHLAAAEELRQTLLARAPLVVESYRERLANLPIEPVEPARLAQEVALLADRCAVDEELARLDSHFTQMRAWLADGQDGEIGKKMDFLIQEMNREANTIGSKAGDTEMTQAVVRLKSEIEKLREQVQNIE